MDECAQAVSADDVRDIMAYVQNPPDVAVADNSDNGCINIDEMPVEESSDSSTLWFVILFGHVPVDRDERFGREPRIDQRHSRA